MNSSITWQMAWLTSTQITYFYNQHIFLPHWIRWSILIRIILLLKLTACDISLPKLLASASFRFVISILLFFIKSSLDIYLCPITSTDRLLSFSVQYLTNLFCISFTLNNAVDGNIQAVCILVLLFSKATFAHCCPNTSLTLTLHG